VKLRTIEAGSGSPVVLLHGLFGAARNFGALQKALASGHRVLAMDARNHGDSPHDPAVDYELMAGDVLETMAALDAVPAAVIGHSMGGKVAMRAALTDPAAVARLLVADIAPVPYAHGSFAAYAAAMQALQLAPGLSRTVADAALASAVPEAGVRGFLLQNLRPGEPASWRIGLDEIAAALPAILDWPETGEATYNGPTLFVAGERSGYIQASHRPAIRALFPRARFVTLKDAGHWLHADNPSGFLAIVSAFLGVDGGRDGS
jgi:pimeloyl-ACP methyl ester carboxylesterase